MWSGVEGEWVGRWVVPSPPLFGWWGCPAPSVEVYPLGWYCCFPLSPFEEWCFPASILMGGGGFSPFFLRGGAVPPIVEAKIEHTTVTGFKKSKNTKVK